MRTVVDLRNDDERGPDSARRPGGVQTVQVPLDGAEDRSFWEVWASGPQFATPLYYRPHLDRFPERNAAVVAAVARAAPGGVVVHCGGGRDRTGQVAMLLLALAGVPADVIADDYALSQDRLRARYAALGEPDQGPRITAFLAERGLTTRGLIMEILSSVDLEARLRAGGLTGHDLAVLRARLVG